MWIQDEESTVADSDEESCLSSEDWEDIQCEILEKQRDEANQRLTELEEVSSQLLKEMNMLEIQFQVERSCRESAEALALQVSKENKVLKRKSQMLLPLISNLPENLTTMTTFEPETDTVVDGDVVDFRESNSEENLLLESQAKITALQASLDGLLAEKLQLEHEVEELTKELVQLREQLVVEAEEKEAILRKMSKQTKAMSKIKRVSQLVTEEFTEMSQKLELEQGLRQHAEVFAHQMLAEQKAAHSPSTMEVCSFEADVQLQLQQALKQIHSINTALCNIQHYYQDQTKPRTGAEEDDDGELQDLREQLKKSEEERKTLEGQLSQANASVAKLREEVKQLQETKNMEDKNEDLEKAAAPAPSPPLPLPPPPPPPPPPPSTNVINLQDFLRSRKKGVIGVDNKPASLTNIKANAVEEMIERIRKGIVLRPIQKIQEEDSIWRDQRSENRKSAVLELKGMLDNIKRQHLHRVPSRRGIGRNVGEAELHLVLQRRRRAMGENQDQLTSAQTYDFQPGQQRAPAAGDCPWASESGTAPVLRRLKQNREKRDSRIRASALIISHGGLQQPFEKILNKPS